MSENTSSNAGTDVLSRNLASPHRQAQFKRLPLSQIRTSRKNPRLIKRQEMIAARAASMAENGQTNPIIVRPLTPQELANDGVLYEIVDGELRYWAALKNGDTEIDASIQEMSPLQAFKKGISANRLNKPLWFEDYVAMEELENTGDIQKQEIAALFEVEPTIVSRAIKILGVLNETSRDLILKNLQKSPDSWQIAENTLYRLADLGDSQAVEASLRVTLGRQMTAPQTQGLVTHVKAGNPSETYQSTATPKKAAPKAKASGASTEADLFGNSTPLAGKEASPSHAPTNSVTTKATSASEAALGLTPESPQSPPSNLGTSQSFFWKWVAGISFISQIRSKLKKGEPLTGGEKALVGTWRLMKVIGWFLKHGFKLLREVLKISWKLLKNATKFLEKILGKKISNWLRWAMAIVIVWGLWYEYHHNPLHQLNVLVSKALSAAWSTPRNSNVAGVSSPVDAAPKEDVSPVAAQPTLVAPLPVAAKPKTASSRPKALTSSVVAFAEGSDLQRPYLETELAALPTNSVVGAFPFTPDAGMGLTMSSRRVSDLMDADKYTMKLGHSTKKILTVNATTTNFTVIYKDADQIGGFLNGDSKMDYYWEEVKVIHINTISPAGISSPMGTQHANIIYQMTLVVADAKQPFTIQCHSAADLQHLVSALEFWVKTARGTAAPLASMPYLNQGLRLGNDGAVTLLWADSPVDKAGVKRGDIAWGLKYSDKQQSKTEIEAELQSLAPGEHNLYIVTPAAWSEAQKQYDPNGSALFSPARTRAKLTAL